MVWYAAHEQGQGVGNRWCNVEEVDTAKIEALQASDAAATALKKAQDLMPAGVDLGKISGGLDGVFGSATDALDGITDVESAKNAIPTLEDAT